MADRYARLVNTDLGAKVAGTLGLPRPAELRRHAPGAPLLHGAALVVTTDGGRMADAVVELLATEEVDHRTVTPRDLAGDHDPGRPAAVVLDATGVDDTSGLAAVYDTFHATAARLAPSGRAVVIGTPPELAGSIAASTAQQALEGFVRSLAKELRGGATANLLQVAPDAEAATASTLRFLLSGRSAYVDGQPIRVTGASGAPDGHDPDRPLADQVAVVTGAARGIGAAIAEVLARDGAHVVCLDLPSQGADLAGVANRVGGESLQLDIAADDAPDRLHDHLVDRHGRVDVLVHNAGVTRDKTVVGMDRRRWDQVLAINLAAQERIDARLLDDPDATEGLRVVTLSSVSGLAGNRGQTNYATSKAGLVGRVRALAGTFAERGGAINAVAPGFIETEMTSRMPTGVREAGRRMSSLRQGGLPVDVAETVAWLADPASTGVNGQVVRVCGQALIGA